MKTSDFPTGIRITSENIDRFPKLKELLDKKLIKLDNNGRFRYLHGAPVGDLALTRINKDGRPVYKESADEWFDPESPKAKAFKWEQRMISKTKTPLLNITY